jgi:hypothetical protein
MPKDMHQKAAEHHEQAAKHKPVRFVSADEIVPDEIRA